jgi:hypothetical protein
MLEKEIEKKTRLMQLLMETFTNYAPYLDEPRIDV